MNKVYQSIGIFVVIIACAALLYHSYDTSGRDVPNLSLEKKIIDVGETKYGFADINVVFVNKAEVPIKITGATTSCSCVVVNRKDIVVPAKGTAEASLHVKSQQNEPNNFVQSVQFYYTNEAAKDKKTNSLMRTVRGRFVEPMFDDRILSPPHDDNPVHY